MTRTIYSPNRDLYRKYYHGGGLPVFRGMRHQAGYGLGSFFSSLKKTIMPLVHSKLLPILKSTGKNLLRSGTDVVSDVILNNKDLKSTVINRGKEALKRSATDTIPFFTGAQSGSGQKRRKKKVKRRITSKNKTTDIFS